MPRMKHKMNHLGDSSDISSAASNGRLGNHTNLLPAIQEEKAERRQSKPRLSVVHGRLISDGLQTDGTSGPGECGYGWVIVGAAFLCSFIVDGIANAFGMYLIEFKDLYPEQSESVLSWIGSLLVGCYLCMGPIACGLADSFGYRIIITSGSLVAAVGFLISAFVSNVHILFLTFGVIGGIGFGLIYSPSIMCVCSYFKEKSALAVGLAVCGSSVGGMVFPLFVQILLEEYGWQGSMLFLSGIALQCCIAGALMCCPKKPSPVIITLSTPGRLTPCLPPLLHQALMDMANLGIYLNPTFLAYSLASFVGSVAFLTPSFFLPDYAFKSYEGLDKETAAVVMTAVCGAGIFGRIFFGYLADHPNFDALGIHNVCIFTSGVMLALVPSCQSFTMLLIDGVFYGFFIAPYISLMSTILTSRLGLKLLPSAFGQTQLIAGVASMVGPPLHAMLGQHFNHEVPFYFAGGAWIMASMLATTIFFFPKRLATRPPSAVPSSSDINGRTSTMLLV